MSATVDTAFDAEQHANAFSPGVEKVYWHRARNRIVYRKLRPHLRGNEPVMEIGCASGAVVAYLRQRGVACEGVDLSPQANIVPGAEGHVRLGIDAFTLPAQERDRAGALLLLDVLEHLPSPGDFLRRCDESFPAVHHVLVTLPARPELWSNYDDFYGHYRRYTLDTLHELQPPPSFRLIDSGYFFHALYWAARGLRVFSTRRNVKVRAPSFPFLHDCIGRVFDWEERVARPSSAGLSLYALYERRRLDGIRAGN
jgi:hypothetical protein